MNKPSFSERINARLREPEGEIFKAGKWRFWFALAFGLSLGSAILTAMIFAWSAGSLTVVAGVLVLWTLVGTLHYSDSEDSQLARGVSLLDSITLICVLAHFTFLLWTFGHLRTLQSAEAKYEAQAERYNAKAEKISADNTKIAADARQIAIENRKAERLRNDTACQLRKAAQSGAKVQTGPSAAGIAPALSTAPIELEKPTKPDESSERFLTRWDFWIRAANLAELLLAAATLIYIRNRSAKTNSPTSAPSMNFDNLLSVAARTPAVTPAFRKTHASYQQEKTQKTHASYDFEGLKKLREALKDISFRLPGHCFKVDVRGDAVWIRMVRANNSTQETIASAKAKLDILDDAVRMERGAFRERLERFLTENGFDLGGNS